MDTMVVVAQESNNNSEDRNFDKHDLLECKLKIYERQQRSMSW